MGIDGRGYSFEQSSASPVVLGTNANSAIKELHDKLQPGQIGFYYLEQQPLDIVNIKTKADKNEVTVQLHQPHGIPVGASPTLETFTGFAGTIGGLPGIMFNLPNKQVRAAGPYRFDIISSQAAYYDDEWTADMTSNPVGTNVIHVSGNTKPTLGAVIRLTGDTYTTFRMNVAGGISQPLM